MAWEEGLYTWEMVESKVMLGGRFLLGRSDMLDIWKKTCRKLM